jgi:starch phosphorylase
MAGLALRASAFANGVSRLHGQISREILHTYLPVVPADELPVGYVTNGAHTRSCVSKEMATLFDRYLGPEWWQKPGQAATWEDVDTIPDEELWSTHERRRERLVAFARKRLMSQLERRGASQRDIERARGVLNTRTLTIGFARRFATYKRANLILRDYERIKNILTSTDRPVQIIFAGKAHPKDNEGKDLLKTVVNFCSKDEIRRNAVFLEDYDIVIARYLVQGVDIWLNTPRRKMEASGTSGMKVLPNGGLNFSILDGWWCEGYSPEVGWAIGKGEDYDDFGYQDHVESNALYDILENEIVPLFYSRSADGLPHGWIARMKTSMRKLSPQFSTNRMIWEYAERFYIPAAAYHGRMTENNNERAKGLAKWKRFIVGNWNDVSVQSVVAKRPDIHRVGEGFEVTADVRLGKIQPSDVSVEVYFGPLDAQRQITDAKSKLMQLESGIETGLFRYAGTVPCEQSGMYGYAVRVRPSHPDANNLMVTGLMRWY